MIQLEAKRLVEERERWHEVCALQRSDLQLRKICKVDETLRHAWQKPQGRDFAWLKVWKEELFPALVYCRHLKIVESAHVRTPQARLSGCDVIVRAGATTTTLEVTMAYPVHSVSSALNPGYQEALRWEKMQCDGWVSANGELARDAATGKVEYAAPDTARSLAELASSWSDGIALALRKKQRSDQYGRGSTLLVYGDGLSGDFEYPERGATLADIVRRIDYDCWANGFDRTVIIGWHPGWYYEN